MSYYEDFQEGNEYEARQHADEEPFIPNPLYYHRKVSCRFVRETEKAFLLEVNKVENWVPKALCREITDSTMYILAAFIKENFK